MKSVQSRRMISPLMDKSEWVNGARRSIAIRHGGVISLPLWQWCIIPLVERGAERGFERAEPGFEPPPLIEAFAADRAPHLLRTGGANGALILVEAEAGFFKFETEMVEQRADFGLGIVDQPFVDDAVDSARLDLIEVRRPIGSMSRGSHSAGSRIANSSPPRRASVSPSRRH